MCGIIGYVNLRTDLRFQFIVHAMNGIESRGRDASGLYARSLTKEIMHLWKSAGPWSRSEGGYNEAVRCSRFGLFVGHTRQATSGSPLHQANNHPIVYQSRVMVHNGVVNCTATDRCVGETDTEEMLTNLVTLGLSKGLRKVRGSAAFLMEHRGYVYAYRHVNPLYAFKVAGGVVFSSHVNDLLAFGRLTGESLEAFPIPEERLFRFAVTAGAVEVTERRSLMGRYCVPKWYDEDSDTLSCSSSGFGQFEIGENRRRSELAQAVAAASSDESPVGSWSNDHGEVVTSHLDHARGQLQDIPSFLADQRSSDKK